MLSPNQEYIKQRAAATLLQALKNSCSGGLRLCPFGQQHAYPVLPAFPSTTALFHANQASPPCLLAFQHEKQMVCFKNNPTQAQQSHLYTS